MTYCENVLNQLKQKHLEEKEYLQAVEEVLNSISVIFEKHPEYEQMGILERLVEPERTIIFRVPWENDDHKIIVNTGYRVQFNGALGPYKGGLRFHPSVNLSTMKFLGFEQTFKNALTTLMMGGGKGGSDFDPKGKSENEIRRFCESFMTEFYRHIGPDTDVPAGDLGVSGREIGYLYGQYRRITNKAELGTLTGKGVGYGGSLVRTEATGYGLIYFLLNVLKKNHDQLKGKRVIVSGCGNVALNAAEKLICEGGILIGISDSKGYILDENMDLKQIRKIKENHGSLSEYQKGEYHEGSIYDHPNLLADIVLPCAIQNEIDLKRAENIKNWQVKYVLEGANMPDDNDAIAYYQKNGIVFVPGKAANAGGVSTSGLEMSQNSIRLSWTFDEVDKRLRDIMNNIFDQCEQMMMEYRLDENDYVTAANLAGANRVISAMISQGSY